jgi:hypothetical protein
VVYYDISWGFLEMSGRTLLSGQAIFNHIRVIEASDIKPVLNQYIFKLEDITK